MAKKLTAKQRKARKHAAYVRAEYYKNVDAIRFLERFGVTADVKIPKKITKKSLQGIRKIYKEMRSNVLSSINEHGEYVVEKGLEAGAIYYQLPTKEASAKEYKAELKLYSTGKVKPFNADEGYIDELKQKIQMLEPMISSTQSKQYYEEKVEPKLDSAKQRIIDSIDDAIKKYGSDIVSHALEDSHYMQKIDELEMKYTYELVEQTGGYSTNDTTLLDLIGTTAVEALKTI